MKLALSFFLIYLISAPLQGQHVSEFDSLIALQKQAQDDDPQVALTYAKVALQLAETLNLPKQQMAAYEAMATTHAELGNYNLALSFTAKAMAIGVATGDSSAVGRIYSDISLIYDQLGDYPKALENSLMSVKTYQALNDRLGLGYCYNDIGVIHYYRDDQELALEYYQRSYDEFKSLGDSVGMALYFNNTANIYSDQGMFDKALEYYWQGYTFDIHFKDRAGQTITLSNIGETYTAMGDYDRAEGKLNEALKLAEEDGDSWGMTNPLRALGDLYRIKKEYNKSLMMIERGLVFADSIQATAEISAAYSSFSEVYEEMGEHETAIRYLRLHNKLDDSLFNANNTRSITEMETRFQTKEKETEIKLQGLEIKQRKNTSYVLGLGLTLAMVMGVFAFLGYKQKKRSNSLLEEKNLIIEEKNRDITDSIEFARTIQEAMLPSVNSILSKFTNSFVLFKPKDIVSGDFFWFRQHSKGDYIAVVDCIGHGVPGAMVSMLGNDMLNQAMTEGSCVHPGNFLEHLNQGVISNFKIDEQAHVHNGMDIAFCRFTPSGGLEYAGAKNPLLIVRNGELIEHKADRVSIGGITPMDFKFKTNNIDLEKGDAVYMFSDGFSDQFGGPKGKKFNIKNFKQLLIDHQDKTMEAQGEMFEKALEDWKGDIEQIDDICIIGIRV